MKHHPVPKIVFGILPVLLATTAMAAAPRAVPAPEGQKAMQMARPIYTWKTDSDNDANGKFQHCLVKNMYDNGTVLMLAENTEGEQRLALHFPQDKMRSGDKFDLTLQVDTSDVFPVEAAAINTRILTIGVPSGLPDQMRKGMNLHIRGPNDEVIYALDGMDGAVSALRDCMMVKSRETTKLADATPSSKDKLAEKPAAMPEPVAAAPVAVPNPVADAKAAVPAAKQAVADATPAKVIAPPVTKPSSPSINPLAMLEEKKKIDVLGENVLPQEWAKILDEAEMAKPKLLPVQSAHLVQPLDYYWQDNGLSYGIKDLPAKSPDLLDKTAKGYLQRMKAQCGKGSFVAEASNMLQMAAKKINWKIAETACSTGKGQDSISAVLAITTPQRSSIVVVHGDIARGADIIKARNAILKAINE